MLRLGLNINLVTTKIDPAEINNLSKAIISDNIYARLISYEDGILKPWLADSFSVKEDRVLISLSNARTSTGAPLTSLDVKTSLERLIKRDTNTHAKLQRFLKTEGPGAPIVVLDDSKIEIRLKKAKYVGTFLRILSSSEYGIVPASALNSSLDIVNYRETTGAFFIDQNKLLKNKYFKNENDYADVVEIVNSGSSTDLTQLFIEGKIDVLPTTVNIDESVLTERLRGFEYNLFKTDKIKLFLAAFGPQALKFSADERGYYIDKLRTGLLKSYPTLIETESTSSFFPTKVSTDVLTHERISSSHQMRQLNFVSYKGLEKAMSGLDNEKAIKVIFSDDFPLEAPFAKRPESFFMMCDVAFDDDFTLYSYVLNNKIIPVEESKKEKILDSLLELEDSREKREILNKFHLEIINEKLVGPLFRAPYTILTRKPMSSYQSKLSASTKLWQIH